MPVHGNITYHDPHFMNILEACLRMEITGCRQVLAARKEVIKKIKADARAQLSTRKQVKERTKQAQDNILVLNTLLKKTHERAVKTSIAMDLMRANIDDAYKLISLEKQRYQKIASKYQETWEAYGAEYEKFPLAKIKSEVKTSLEMLRVEKMVVEYKITRSAKIMKQEADIAWLRTRAKIIEFASVLSSNTKIRTKLATLRTSLTSHEAELESMEAEIRVCRKRREEAEKTRLLNLLIMPPPKINLSQMRPLNMPKRQQPSMPDRWKYYRETSTDSMSVNSITLEEMCMTEDEPIRVTQRVRSNLGSARENFGMEETEPLAKHPSRRSENIKAAKHGLPVSEVDLKRSSLGQLCGEVEKSMVEEKFGAGRRYGGTIEEEAEREAKRMKLAAPMEMERCASNAVVSPRVLQDASTKRSSALPRIKQIETVNYDVSPALRLAGNNIPASSMFSRHHFERYHSNASSIIDMEQVPRKEQTPVREEYMCNYNFSECSDLSLPFSTNEDARNEAFPSGRTSVKDGSKLIPSNFKQIDFSNVLKKNQGPTSLF